MRRLSPLPVLFVTAALWCAAPAEADSIFSSLGLGESSTPTTAREAAMGGTGISLADSVCGSFLNPASGSLLRGVTISVAFSPQLRYARGPEGAGKNWSSRLDGVKLVFPLPRGVALSAGFLLWGDMNSSAEWSGQSPSHGYLGIYDREGGIFSIPCHVSVRFKDRLVLAGGIDVVQVSSQETWQKDFQSSDYQDSNDLLEGRYSGARASFAALLRWPGKLELGFTLADARNLDGTLTTRPAFGTDFESRSVLHLPGSVGGGISVHPRPGWTLAVEGNRTSWSKLRIDALSPLPDRSSYGIGVGLERAPARRMGTGSARFPLRIGYRQETQPFDWPQGEAVESQWITLGTGFPLKERASRLDLALVVGQIGSESRNGAEERVFRLLISFTASESWHRKRQTQY